MISAKHSVKSLTAMVDYMKELLETGAAGDLEYNDSCDALIGRINGLVVAIKENDQTKSYGCLIWVGPEDGADPDAAKNFLAEEAAAKPHIIKNYRAAGRGAAIALVKYNDAARNISNITRLMSDIADGMLARSFVNCCYRCGRHDSLSLYSDKGVPVLCCDNCGRGTILRSFGGRAVPEREAPVISADDPVLGGLLADGTEEAAPEPENKIRTADDNIDLSALLFEGIKEEAKPEPPRSEIFEAAQREFEEQKKHEVQESDDALDSLMFVAGEDTPAEEPAPAVRVSAPAAGDIKDLDGLLFDGTDTAEEEKPSAEERAASAANIDDLMFDASEEEDDTPPEKRISEVETQAPAALGSEIDGLMVGEVSEVTSITAVGRGEGEDIQVETEEEEYVGLDDEVEVTAIHDDSNDGEYMEVTELDSKLGAPTDAEGGELEAGETPLEADGSVPLVNPNSGFADIKPSSAYGPGAVRAYAAGSYEGADIAEEPVGFDGRRKTDAPVSDPRLGDEMGFRSRDFRSQQVSESGRRKRKVVSRKVSSNARSSTNINYSYSAGYGSKPVVGTISAVIFGLVGAGLWAGAGYLLDMLGNFTPDTASLILAVCAFLPTLFAFVGYRIGGDCFDKKGIIISVIVSVILDLVGAFALFVTTELRWTAQEYGYSVSLDKAIERVGEAIAGTSTEIELYGRLLIIAVIMVISLAVGIVTANRQSE